MSSPAPVQMMQWVPRTRLCCGGGGAVASRPLLPTITTGAATACTLPVPCPVQLWNDPACNTRILGQGLEQVVGASAVMRRGLVSILRSMCTRKWPSIVQAAGMRLVCAHAVRASGQTKHTWFVGHHTACSPMSTPRWLQLWCCVFVPSRGNVGVASLGCWSRDTTATARCPGRGGSLKQLDLSGGLCWQRRDNVVFECVFSLQQIY